MKIESKYDFDLDMVNTNSLSLIINQIKRGSTVLEFGPANGRMTRYLKEVLNCKVYLVEIDEEAGKEALQYAKDLLVDDIETFSWLVKYEDLRFDYITFADVLEHLRDPEKVLIQAKTLLKQDGSILLSVPNLAHNSVLINLMNHEFEYTKVGLLDNTHIHFFTKNSLENAMNRTGLHVAKRFATYAPVGATEIETSYDAVPGIDATYWRNREYGDIYQFVYEVKKGDEFIENRENYLKRGTHPYFIQVYFDYGDGCQEGSSRTFPVDNVFALQNIEFDVDNEVRSIRLDPFNGMCMVDIEWFADVNNGEEKPLRFMDTSADYRDSHKFIFTGEDPFIIYAPAEGRQFHHLKLRLRYITVDSIKVASMQEFFTSVMGNNEQIIQGLQLKIEAMERQLVEYEKVRKNDERVNGELSQSNSELSKINAMLKRELDSHAATIQELMGSTSWKLTKPLRKIGDVLHGRG